MPIDDFTSDRNRERPLEEEKLRRRREISRGFRIGSCFVVSRDDKSFVITERNEESKFTRAAYELTVRVRCSYANYEFDTIFGEGCVFSVSFSLASRMFFAGRERSGENAITLVYPLFRKGKFSGVNAPRSSSDGALNNILSLSLSLSPPPPPSHSFPSFFFLFETRRYRRRQSASLAVYFAGCSAM